MDRFARALRYSGLGALAGVGSQQVARRNAATAAALLLQRREEREAVDAFLAQRLDARVRAAGRSGTAS
ncbi:MAG: hypothetical protein M3165_04810 [Actinomycetota bacterium]|nr:hypothetical protein [Actinomycetota bacterium]